MAPLSIDNAGTPLLVFDEHGGVGGWWGPVTSSIDWCEHNYVVSPYIAEFFNTMSNVGMVLLGLLTMYLHLRDGSELRYVLAGFTLFFIGVGSTAFHGTLTHVGQQGDETPMVIGSAVWCWCLGFHDPAFEARHAALQWWSAVCIGVFVVLFGVLHYIYSFVVVFQVLILVLSTVMISTLTSMWRRDPLRGILTGPFVVYIGSMAIAFALWLVDQHFCAHLHTLPGGLPNPQFHAWWHLLAGVNCYLGPVIEGAIRLAARGKKPRLVWLLGCIPYPTAARESNKD